MRTDEEREAILADFARKMEQSRPLEPDFARIVNEGFCEMYEPIEPTDGRDIVPLMPHERVNR